MGGGGGRGTEDGLGRKWQEAGWKGWRRFCFPHVIVTQTNKLRVCSWGKWSETLTCRQTHTDKTTTHKKKTRTHALFLPSSHLLSWELLQVKQIISGLSPFHSAEQRFTNKRWSHMRATANKVACLCLRLCECISGCLSAGAAVVPAYMCAKLSLITTFLMENKLVIFAFEKEQNTCRRRADMFN